MRSVYLKENSLIRHHQIHLKIPPSYQGAHLGLLYYLLSLWLKYIFEITQIALILFVIFNMLIVNFKLSVIPPILRDCFDLLPPPAVSRHLLHVLQQ